MQRRPERHAQNQACPRMIFISSAYDFWNFKRISLVLHLVLKKKELCAFSDSWTQPACFFATWETCSTRHCKTPAQLDDARCQTGVSLGGTPASLQHPTICLKPRWHSICRKRSKSGITPHIRHRFHHIKQNMINKL